MVNTAVSHANQKLMIQQNRDIISEQVNVKAALNGSQDKILDNQKMLLDKVEKVIPSNEHN
jgi:hypothetical protein